MHRFLIALCLSACTGAVAQDAPADGMIEVFTGTYRHNVTIRVWSDDQVQVEVMPTDRVVGVQSEPGLFARLSDILREDGPAAAASAEGSEPCPDFGGTTIRADPPIAGFAQASVGCPEAVVSGLAERLFTEMGVEW